MCCSRGTAVMGYSCKGSIHIFVVNIVVTEEEDKDHALTKSALFRNGMIIFFCIQFHKRRLSLTYLSTKLNILLDYWKQRGRYSMLCMSNPPLHSLSISI